MRHAVRCLSPLSTGPADVSFTANQLLSISFLPLVRQSPAPFRQLLDSPNEMDHGPDPSRALYY